MRNSIRFILALCAALSCHAVEGVFMIVEGIPGEVTLKGRENQIQAFAISHEIVSPRDSASGQATGKRQHTPIRCVIQQGKSTPVLMKHLTENKTIPKIVINFWRPSAVGTVGGTGAEVLYFKYELTNASISSVRPWMANTKDASVAPFGTQVEVSFTYQKIEWTYTTDGITHEDSWETAIR